MTQTNPHPTGLPLITGKVNKPQRVVVYGPEGIGKSTLAADFPSPIFLDTEGGTTHLDITRFPTPENWDAVLFLIAQLAATEHGFRTLVIDTVDWLERLLIEHLCRKNSKDGIEDFGYGKGYTYLAEEFSRFLQSLEALRLRGMHLVLVAHSTIRKFEQPDAAGAYDRYELKLSKQCAPLVKEWCDMLLFVNYHTTVTDNNGRKRAVGGRERRIHTTHCAAYDAKNRHGLEERLPMSFSALAPLFAEHGTPVVKPAPPIEQIETLWKRLGYGAEERAKLFRWLEIDAIPGEERWNDLTPEQLGKAITFLTRKLREKAA